MAVATAVRFGVAIVLILLLAIASLRLLQWGLTQQVSFDGAMNLEVARSLAEGHGYRRMYGDQAAFSPAIQTRAPYLLPAAAVFATFGVGLWQAQLANLLYLALLAAAAFALARRWLPWPWPLAAAAAVIGTPGMAEYGLNGYGEAPALAWWLLSLLVLYPREPARPLPLARVAAAGLLAGVAMLTKTVLLAGLAAALPVLLLHQLGYARRRHALAACSVLVAGALVPLALHEAWRASALPADSTWWQWALGEYRRIRNQAVGGSFADTAGLLSKLHLHAGILAGALGFALPLALAWLLLPFAALAAGARRFTALRGWPVLATLALLAALYFAWWLGITPTQKAWYRRIFNGVIVIDLLAVLVAGSLWTLRAQAPSWRRAATIGMLALLLPAAAAVASLLPRHWPDDASRRALVADLAAVDALPRAAALFGTGWYSSPHIALYAGRHIDNLVAQVPERLAQRGNAYLLVDPAMAEAGADVYWLQRYPHREVQASQDLRIVALDTRRVADPFAGRSIDSTTLRSALAFDRDGGDAALFGFHQREGDGWRWMAADAEALLRYDGGDALQVDAYMPEPEGYRHAGGVTSVVWLGECRLGEVRHRQSGRRATVLALQPCPLQPGQVVRVRLRSDNVLRVPTDRQLSLVIHAIGFVDTNGRSPVSD